MGASSKLTMQAGSPRADSRAGGFPLAAALLLAVLAGCQDTARGGEVSAELRTAMQAYRSTTLRKLIADSIADARNPDPAVQREALNLLFDMRNEVLGAWALSNVMGTAIQVLKERGPTTDEVPAMVRAMLDLSTATQQHHPDSELLTAQEGARMRLGALLCRALCVEETALGEKGRDATAKWVMDRIDAAVMREKPDSDGALRLRCLRRDIRKLMEPNAESSSPAKEDVERTEDRVAIPGT